MDFKIKTMESFRVVGKSVMTSHGDFRAEKEVSEFWVVIENNGLFNRFIGIADKNRSGILSGAIGPLPDSMRKVYRRIFSEWFPSSGYEHAKTPVLEVFHPGDFISSDYRCEIWIPVIKKE